MIPGNTIRHELYDAVIVGGGPAGISCAVWLARLGFAPLLIEAASELGGLCRSHAYADVWNATLPGKTGVQVADNLSQSLHDAAVPLRLGRRAAHIAVETSRFSVLLEGEAKPCLGSTVVLASGVLPRGLPEFGGIPGVLVGPGSHVSDLDFTGKRVAILGGGDNAFENGLYALDHGAASVRVHARGVRAQRQFVQRLPESSVQLGDYSVDAPNRRVNGVQYDFLLVFYGWEPCVEYASGLGLRFTSDGFIATDMHSTQTSCPGVYAVGEVAQRQHPCVVTALADGVAAAKAIQALLEGR